LRKFSFSEEEGEGNLIEKFKTSRSEKGNAIQLIVLDLQRVENNEIFNYSSVK
jgi:hypothetical protein